MSYNNIRFNFLYSKRKDKRTEIMVQSPKIGYGFRKEYNLIYSLSLYYLSYFFNYHP